jgi:DNA polymerase-4
VAAVGKSIGAAQEQRAFGADHHAETEDLAKEIDGTPFRLMGTGVSALRPGSQADDTDVLDRRSAHAERAIGELSKKFGNAAVISGIAYDGPEKPE